MPTSTANPALASRRRPSPAAVRLARPVLVAGCMLIANTAFTDGRVSGRVSDGVTQSALPGAEISVVGSPARAVTAADGSFSLSLPPGTYSLNSYYLGYPSQTVDVTVVEGSTVPARFSLGSAEDIVTLETFTVEGSRTGQARALNQQRTSTNLVNIVSSDLSGQFPDKTIADAVKRLPGVTVETDPDSGGSEGRYITIRGMNADFNAVSINGMRAAVSDFSGLSRRVPLDVVSAKSADQIEVTKSLRPDQDGDGIGGAVNIVTRSPFAQEGYYLGIEGAVGYNSLASEYTSNYPFTDTNKEFSAAFSSLVGDSGKQGVALSANFRDRAFLKQRVSTTGWRTVAGFYRPDNVVLQHFYDDVTAKGLTATYELRPSDNARFRIDASLSSRETERGRQRQVIYYGNVDAGAQNDGETYTGFTSSTSNSGNNRRVERNVRQFFETQELINVVASGTIKSDGWTFTPTLGVNHGSFDGDPDRDLSARFRTNRGTTNYTANGYLPEASITGINRQDPGAFFLNSLDRGTAYVTDETYTAGVDAQREATLFGADGFWKVGVKSTRFSRDYVREENFYLRNTIAIPDVFASDALASYRAKSTLDGVYDYGFFIDPEQVRAIASTPGRLNNPATDNRIRSIAGSYEADEVVDAGYGMGQFTWDKITVVAGTRAELTRTSLDGNNANVNSVGDYFAPLTPYSESNSYVNVLPGVNLRYEQRKDLVYRFAVTRSIARPRLNDLVPIDVRDASALEIRRGNQDLDPTTSTNFDLGVEYYFANAGTLSAGVFHKAMVDNIYTTRSSAPDSYVLVERANAESASVSGFELSYDHQFNFLPAPLDGLGAFINYTYADSEVDTGLAAFKNTDLPLFNQVENTVNAGLFYDRAGFRARVSLLYRSESLVDLATDNSTGLYDTDLSRYLGATTTLDVTASYQFAKHWQVFTEFSNVLDEETTAYNGDESRPDYYEITGWTAAVGLRWSL